MLLIHLTRMSQIKASNSNFIFSEEIDRFSSEENLIKMFDITVQRLKGRQRVKTATIGSLPSQFQSKLFAKHSAEFPL